MKICAKCKETKKLELFNKRKSNKDGRYSYCKVCSTKEDTDYKRTEKGLVLQIYTSQRASSRRRKHPKPEYSKQELIDWVFSRDNFLELYRNWYQSGYKKELKPSVDRLDDSKHYSIKNIQLITWEENNNKGNLYKAKKFSKAIKGVHISTGKEKNFKSMRDAERETGISNSHISQCCQKKRKSAGGYRWYYEAS